MRLVGQTQAMPGYTNSIKITFKESGIYKLLCMEYCGLAHHAMITDFTVVD
jgi:cytochrome c oxidase subunit 2